MANATCAEISPRGKVGSQQKTRVFVNRGNANVINSVVCDSNSIAYGAKTVEVVSPRQRSPKPRSNRGSPTIQGHYAGAKFHEPPSAAALPPPPLHWTHFDNASHQLKLLLNVQA